MILSDKTIMAMLGEGSLAIFPIESGQIQPASVDIRLGTTFSVVEDTSSYINTKSISKDGGISTFRSAVVINKDAKNSKAAVSCQSLMLDTISRSDTIPAMLSCV